MRFTPVWFQILFAYPVNPLGTGQSSSVNNVLYNGSPSSDFILLVGYVYLTCLFFALQKWLKFVMLLGRVCQYCLFASSPQEVGKKGADVVIAAASSSNVVATLGG